MLQLFSNMHEERPYSEGLLSEDQKMYPNKVDKEEEKHSELSKYSLILQLIFSLNLLLDSYIYTKNLNLIIQSKHQVK